MNTTRISPQSDQALQDELGVEQLCEFAETAPAKTTPASSAVDNLNVRLVVENTKRQNPQYINPDAVPYRQVELGEVAASRGPISELKIRRQRTVKILPFIQN